MRRVASVAEVRAADAAAVTSVGEEVLIRRAAVALATTVIRAAGRVRGVRTTVLAGSGHNGADALWAGAHLAGRGADVTIVRSSDSEPDERGSAALRGALRAGCRLAVTLPASSDLVIDGMVGVGARGGLHGRAAELASALPGLGAFVVAVDLPSGVAADTGSVGDGGAVRAALTVTFDALKPGLVLGQGAVLAGVVEVLDVGLGLAHAAGPVGMPEAADIADLLPEPTGTDDKYTRGVVGVLTGSEQYPGAAVLSVGGAVRAGAGYVRYLGAAVDGVRAAWPSVVAGDGRCDAVVVGSGLGTSESALDRVRELLSTETPLVLDADALAVGADAVRARAGVTLITPHAGEFRRLTGTEPAGDPLGAARAAAADLGVTVLLKGRRTVVAAPDGTARVIATGCPWLSTAGTGDVLAGAAGALLAALVKRGHPAGTLALDAGMAASHLHGLAGWIASNGAPLAAPDLLAAWSTAVREVRCGSVRSQV